MVQIECPYTCEHTYWFIKRSRDSTASCCLTCRGTCRRLLNWFLSERWKLSEAILWLTWWNDDDKWRRLCVCAFVLFWKRAMWRECCQLSFSHHSRWNKFASIGFFIYLFFSESSTLRWWRIWAESSAKCKRTKVWSLNLTPLYLSAHTERQQQHDGWNLIIFLQRDTISLSLSPYFL
jgi:hypothetical protein